MSIAIVFLFISFVVGTVMHLVCKDSTSGHPMCDPCLIYEELCCTECTDCIGCFECWEKPYKE